MPIDFEAVAERFREQVSLEARRAVFAERAISRVLGKRRTAALAVEQATRMFPIVRFYDGAVTMVLPPSQRGILAVTSPPPSFVDRLARGGMGFLEGVARTIEPFTAESQETAIGRFATSLDRALAAVVSSIRRFEEPTAEMFDPRRLGAGDLIGLAALGFRALAEASRQGGEIERFADQIRGALDVFRGEEGGRRGRSSRDVASPPEGPSRSLTEQLDAGALLLTGGAVIFGLLPELIGTLLAGALIRVRVFLLQQLEDVERLVRGFVESRVRRAITGVIAWADRAIDIVAAIRFVVGANVEFMLRFWRRIGGDFAEGVRLFSIGLVDFLRAVVDVMRALPGWLDALVSFDLTSLIDSAIGRGIAWIEIGGFSLADVLDADGRRVNVWKAMRMSWALDDAQALVDAGRAAAWPFAQDYFDEKDRQIEAARWLVDELFPGWSGPGPHTIIIPAEVAPTAFRSQFPDLSQTLFGGGRAQRLVGVVDRLQASLELGVTEALRRTRDGFGRFATEFERAGVQAARVRGGINLRRIGDQSTLLADRVFGPEVTAARESVRDQPPNALARAFESWLATGGFTTIGEVIPSFVGEMARHWREQIQRGEEPTAPVTPTSPRILRQHAALGRVQVPRLTFRVPAWRELDNTLADEVAVRFTGAVGDAYASGRRRLAELAALPGD